MTAATTTTSDSARTVTVVIADDDARVRHALHALVETERGIVVVGEAGCTAEALEREQHLRPAVILLDLVFPTADEGLCLLHVLARERRRRVVAISIHGGFRQAALEAGAAAFVEKGAAPDVILNALRAAGTR